MLILKRVHPAIKEIELHQGPIIITVTEFNDTAVASLAEGLQKAIDSPQEFVPIVVQSYGGSVYALFQMIDMLASCPKPIMTICQGRAMSCGAALLTCGAEGMRYCAPEATIMIHEVSAGTFNKIEEMKVDVAEAERLNKKMFHIMAKNCSHGKNYFQDEIHRRAHADWFLDAKEAKRINLVNHIGLPMLEIEVDVKIKLVK